MTAGGNNIINLLEVAGEQQVMLRVVVAEVNRAAARSIGLNFAVTSQQGITVFANRTGPVTGGFTYRRALEMEPALKIAQIAVQRLEAAATDASTLPVSFDPPAKP